MVIIFVIVLFVRLSESELPESFTASRSGALDGAEGAVISTLIDVVPLKSEIFPAGSVTLYLKTKSPSLSFEIVGTVKLCSVTSASLVPVTIGVFSSFTYNEI